MGLFNFIANTIEGAAEIAVNLAVMPVAAIIAPLDGGELFEASSDRVLDGLNKIGDSTPPKDGKQ
jgi:hypothetical protein